MRNRAVIKIVFGVCLLSAALAVSCGDGDTAIRASGTIEATLVTVSAQVSGSVREVRSDEGARVKKADVLVRINATVFELQKKQAEAQLVQAENNNRVAGEDARRTLALFKSGSVTQKQRDDTQARADVAQAQVDAARIAVSLCDEQLRHATVTAPINGVVTHKLVEEGELVFPGSALFSITDLSRVFLTIYLTERDLARVSIGQKAEVTIDAFEKRKFSGEVTYISPQAEFTPKNVQAREDRVKLVFAVKISIPNPDEVLKPGVPADAVLVEGKGPGK
jgi:HlyD family secretion protein